MNPSTTSTQPPAGQADERDEERRLYRQSRALVALAKLAPRPGQDHGSLCAPITELVAQTLGVERASVWLYTDDQRAIRCVDLYERGPGRHSAGGLLEKDLFPSYFLALEEERPLAAHDVSTDPRVLEFLEPYLVPLGISSMLDAPVRVDGRLAGVLCCEHVGPQRTWSWDEQHFAGAAGDLVALALESSGRQEAEALQRRMADLDAGLRPRASAVVERAAALLASGAAPAALADELRRIEADGRALLGVLDGALGPQAGQAR